MSVHSCKALLLLYQKKSSGAKIGFCSKIQPFNLVITSNDKIENAIKIGPVLEKVNRKKSESTLLDVYKRFYKVFDTTSKERLVQSDAKRVVNVHTVTSAEIQFQLLSNNVGQPATIDENAEKMATFVLYNHARIVQILHASKEISAKNQQCAENTVINLIVIYLFFNTKEIRPSFCLCHLNSNNFKFDICLSDLKNALRLINF